MEVLFGIGIAIGSIMLVMALRSFTTLFHEMGHALPALIFSKEKVQVYVGTYGNTDSGINFNLGRLEIFFRFNFLAWNIGMCRHEGNMTIWRSFLIILGGPIASLLISIPLIIWATQNDNSSLLNFGIFVFAMAAALDFISNLFPMGSQSYTDNGQAIYNDGMQLVSLWKRLSLPDLYFEMEKHVHDKDYVAAIEKGKSLVMDSKTKPAVYDLMITALQEEKEYEDIITAVKLKSQHYELTAADYHVMGSANTKLNRFDEALKFLNQACYKEYSNAQMLLDRGYLHLQTSDPHSALDDLNAALYYNGGLTDAVLYRSLALIRLDEPGNAILDLDHLLKIEKDNSDAWFYLGEAHEKRKENKKALFAYQKAKELGCDLHGLDYRLQLLE